MRSDRAARAIVGGAAVLALAVCGWLWLGVDASSDSSESAASLAAGEGEGEAAGSSSAELPTSRLAAAEPLPEASTDGEPAKAPDSALADPGRKPTLATVGLPLQLSGRVVDGFGRPLAGAMLRHQPSTATLGAVGINLKPFRSHDDLDWDALPHTLTDAAGRFAFTVRELPRKDVPGQDLSRPGGGSYQPPVANVPRLIVTCPGFGAAVHVCLTYTAGDLDVGDIVLAPGAALSGRLVDEQGAAIAGARVSIPSTVVSPDMGRSGEWHVVADLLETRSADDGGFLFDSLWPAEHELRFEAEGYAPLDRKLKLVVGPVQDIGDVVLQRGGLISGWVMDAEGRPLAGARVKARPPGPLAARFGAHADSVRWELGLKIFGVNRHEVDVLTDADGAWTIGTLLAPEHDVFADADGHEPIKLARVATGKGDVRLVLPRQATALLTVVDSTTRAPLAGVTATGMRHVSADPQDDQGETALNVLAEEQAARVVGATSSTGLLLAQGLGSRRNTLLVSAPGYANTRFELPGVPAPERLVQTLELPREAVVAGRVVDRDGAPIPGALVVVTPPASVKLRFDPRQETDEHGRFRLGALAAGTWSLVASATGFVSSEPQALTLAVGQTLDAGTVMLTRGGVLTGVVLGADGTPAVGASVGAELPLESAVQAQARVEGADLHRVRRVITGPDGRFRFEQLAAGLYRVRCDPGGEAMADVTPGTDADIVLQLRQRPRLHGRVVDADGPVAEADVLTDVEMQLGFLEDQAAQTSPDGEYAFELDAPGTFRILASEGGAQTPATTVTLQWGDDRQLDLAFGGARLEGRVVAADTGAPLAAQVVLIDDSTQPATWIKLESDKSGRFEARRLQPGAYRVEASRSGYATTSAGVVDVPRPDGAPPLRLELQPGAGVSGVVRSSTGGDIPRDVLLFIVGDGVLDAGGAPLEVSFNVKPDGNYQWNRLPAGSFLVQVRRRTSAMGAPTDWRQLAEKRATLLAGQSQVIDFVIDL